MKGLKIFGIIVAVLVLLICVYSFLLGNDVFHGRFENDGLAWYFLAKGIFGAAALYLLVLIIERVKGREKA